MSKKVKEAPKCRICGKLLTDEESIARGIGPVCMAWSGKEDEIKTRLAGQSVDEAPEDYIPLKVALELCAELGIPWTRLIRAMGSNQIKGPVRSPNFLCVYVGNRRFRFLPKGVLAEIPELLKTGSDAPKKKRKAKKKPKAKKKSKATLTAAEKKALKAANKVAAKAGVAAKTKVVDVSKGKQYEVVAEGYSSPVTTLCTIREFKNQEKWATGSAPKLTRKRSTGGYFYADEEGNPVLRAID